MSDSLRKIRAVLLPATIRMVATVAVLSAVPCSEVNAYGIGTGSPRFSDVVKCGGTDTVPVHQLITREAAAAWPEVPDELYEHLGFLDVEDGGCRPEEALFNNGDGIITGSKEEDEQLNPLRADLVPGECGSGNEVCTAFGLNAMPVR